MRYFVNLDPTPGAEPIVVDLTELPTGALDVSVGGKHVDVDVVSLGSDASRTLSVRVAGHMVDLTTEGQPPELGAIDKAALPSAMMPFSPAAETATDTEHAATLDKAPLLVAARPSRRWTIAQSVMAVVAVVAPLTMMYFLLVWQNDRGPKGTSPAATSAATATPPVSSGKAPSPSATPTSLPSVGPKVEEAPSASAAPAATTPPAPTAAVDASAAKPAPTPAPLQPPRGPALPKTGSSSKPLAPIPPPPPDQDPGINE